MILTGGEWCLMPGSAAAHPMVSSAAGAGHAAGGGHAAGERSAVVASGHDPHDVHGARVAHHPDGAPSPGAPSQGDPAHGDPGHGDPAHGDRAPVPDRTSPPGAPTHHADGGGCESQAACSIAITPASWQVVRGGEGPLVRPTIDSSERPASLVLAPELPPPRA